MSDPAGLPPDDATPSPSNGATRAFAPTILGDTHAHTPEDSAAGDSLWTGLPGYAIQKELGRGGMGVVYLARHDRLNRDVAVKMVLAGAHASHGDLVRFVAEAEATAALSHPNIVQVHEFGQHAGLPYFTLEYVAGGSLEVKVAAKPLPPLEAARLISAVAKAVHYAHGQGIVHRDLKPANILLSNSGEPKVADFGLAKRLNLGDGITRTGAVMGTPYYMAPEQARGDHKSVGPATDVWALGAVLYRVLGGRPPFQAATAALTYHQILHEESVPLRRLVPGLPRDLETICCRCLAKEPEQRYPSAAALAEDLDRYLSDRPILARPAGPIERTVRWSRRNPRVAVLLGLLAVVIATAMVSTTILWQRADDRATEALRERALAVEAKREALISAEIANKAKKDADEQKAIALENFKTAEQEAKKATEVARLLGGIFEASDPLQISGSIGLVTRASGEALTAPAILDRGAALLKQQTLDPAVRAKLLQTIGNAYVALGKYDQAEPLLDDAARALRTFPDAATNAELAATLGSRAWLAHVRGLYPDARKLYQESLAIRDRRPQNVENELAAAATKMQYAILLAAMERFPEAAAMSADVVKTRKRLLAPKHREVALALLSQAIVAFQIGDLATAALSSRSGIEILIETEGDKRLARAVSLLLEGILGEVQDRDLAASERKLVEALELARKVLTDYHFYVVVIRFELAVVQNRINKLDEAEHNFKTCFELAKDHGWLLHPSIGYLVDNITLLLIKRNKGAEAKLIADTWVAAHRAVGRPTVLLADTLTSASSVYLQLHDYDTRKRYLEEADAIYRREPESQGRRARLHNLFGLGYCHHLLCNFADAERYFREFLEARRGQPAGLDIDAAYAAAGIVRSQFRQGTYLPDAPARLTEAQGWVTIPKKGSPPRIIADIALLHSEYARHALDFKTAAKWARAAYDSATARNEDHLQMLFIARELLLCAADSKGWTPSEVADIRATALAAIRWAVELGYANLNALRTDPLYQPLKGNPEFERILEKLAERKE